MNSRFCAAFRDDMEALLAGRDETLAGERVAQLEQHLVVCARCTAAVSAAPARGGFLPSAERPPAVAKFEWDAIWSNIAAKTMPSVQGIHGGRARQGPSAAPPFAAPRPAAWRTIQPLVALAACALLAVLLHPLRPPAPARAHGWPLDLSGPVEIHSLEVPGDATVNILLAGNDDSMPVIWVMEDHDES